ncbi:hypothetical protein [Microbispora bryophytorum]|uniref:hypothetical protein n=1 Tax=Microbispora bryophytorum TaxID=1460882 RepID=UPI00340BC7D9
MFAGEPIIEVSGPIAEVQLAETVLLNHITFQTTVATKAARCVLAAGRARLIDFAFRRTKPPSRPWRSICPVRHE